MKILTRHSQTILKSTLCACAIVLALPVSAWSKSLFSTDAQANHVERTSSGGMVSSQEAIASQVGAYILKEGGNAIDAAVAIGFAMAVTYPQAGNLGGGGFMLVHDAKSGDTKAIDYREVAPSKATADMFLNKDGTVDIDRVRFSHKSAGVPGTVRGLELALNLYGTMTLEEVMNPAILLAENGFVISPTLGRSFQKYQKNLRKSVESSRVFLKNGHTPRREGGVLRQPDLAKTLKDISKNGADAFYTGDIAKKIVKSMREHDGLISASDLYEYSPILREPLWGTYEGYKIASMPPPSSGGVHLIQMLNLLGRLNISETEQGSADSYHLMAEAMRIAYADRSKYLGDPQFVRVPTDALMSDIYAQRKAEGISLDSITPSKLIEPGAYLPYESRQTTHFSVMDKWGNVVSNTYTLNFPYGSGRTVEGTGILLNNEMDDFAAKAGVPNAFGLVGAEANKIEPRKRPLSSMTPTIVFNKKEQPIMALGAPGGSRIINAVLQTILNMTTYDMSPKNAVSAPRIHHQWLPDVLSVEEGVSEVALRSLKQRGHTIKDASALGAVQLVALVNSNGKLVSADSDFTDINAPVMLDLENQIGVPNIDDSTGLIREPLASYDQFGYRLVGVADTRKRSATSVAEVNIGTTLIPSQLAWISPPQYKIQTAQVDFTGKSAEKLHSLKPVASPSLVETDMKVSGRVALYDTFVPQVKVKARKNTFDDIEILFEKKAAAIETAPVYRPSRKIRFSERFNLSK